MIFTKTNAASNLYSSATWLRQCNPQATLFKQKINSLWFTKSNPAPNNRQAKIQKARLRIDKIVCSRLSSNKVTTGMNALTNHCHYHRHLSIYSRVPNHKDSSDSCRHGIDKTRSTRGVSWRYSIKSQSRNNCRRKEIRLSESRASDEMRPIKKSRTPWLMCVQAWARSRARLTVTRLMTIVSM